MASDILELWQEYDERGLPVTTKGITRKDAWGGILHGSAHVWIWRENEVGEKEILVQLRAQDKETWPGFYDISAAGHLDFGEEPIQAAIRETDEEIGASIDKTTDLRLLFVYRQHIKDEASGCIENEFQWVYGIRVGGEQQFTFNDREVDKVLWLASGDFQKAVRGDLPDIKIVPQGEVYFANLLRALSL